MLLLTLLLPSSRAPRAAPARPPLHPAGVPSRPLLIQHWQRLPGETRLRARWLTSR
jgi:hypothetical protein